MSQDHKLMPKHGEQFSVPIDRASKEIAHIIRLQYKGSLALVQIFDFGKPTKDNVIFPCKQCVLDVALHFHDLSEALKAFAK